jgi:hypothetical protein
VVTTYTAAPSTQESTLPWIFRSEAIRAPRESSEARTRSRSSLRSSSAAETIMDRTAVQADAIRSCTSPRPSTSDFSRSTRARVSVSDWRSEAKSVRKRSRAPRAGWAGMSRISVTNRSSSL